MCKFSKAIDQSKSWELSIVRYRSALESEKITIIGDTGNPLIKQRWNNDLIRGSSNSKNDSRVSMFNLVLN